MCLKLIRISIDDRDLNHLRFTNDFVLLSEILKDASTLLTEINSASEQVGLKINLAKPSVC